MSFTFTKKEIEKTMDEITELVDLYEINDDVIVTEKSNVYCEYKDAVFEFEDKMKIIKEKVDNLYDKVEDFLNKN